MPAHLAGIRFPCTRVLLPRTRLAYIHLRNLLSDAKRDRAARVSGYVAIWLPEEFLLLYMEGGELVNATIADAKGFRGIPIAHALEKVPAEPEYGEICFHEAPIEQLAAMFAAQTQAPDPWPAGFVPGEPGRLFPYLNASMFDGVVEIATPDSMNYLQFEHGSVVRAFLASGGNQGTVVERVAQLFGRDGRIPDAQLRRWPGPLYLMPQAPPQLVAAYRELLGGVVAKLVAQGKASAPTIAENARTQLLGEHPCLDAFSFNGRQVRDPLCDSDRLTLGVAALLKDVLFATGGDAPEALLKELTWPRRHLFQSAGLYECIPWKVM